MPLPTLCTQGRGCLYTGYPSPAVPLFVLLFNPLSPKTDQHEFSPQTISIHNQERLRELINDHLRENALISYQILSATSLRKYVEISLENEFLYVHIGA